MGINCRIHFTQNGNIDYVEAPNGNRSLLFDALRAVVGDEKAQDYYALTETEVFKDAVNADVNLYKENIAKNFKVNYYINKDNGILSPANSSNYANLTEDGQGNFVFYHRGGDNYKVIKKSSGSTLATSKTEASALSKVGGVAMYYTKETDAETAVSSTSQYIVKVPVEKVYDFNTDSLNLIEEARELHSKENPDSAFDANTQVAYVTKLAAKKGFEMVVSEWNGKTRAQTTKEFEPVDSRVTEGNTIVKDFEQTYKSNTEKGFESVIPQSKSDKLQEVYNKIYSERNAQNVYDSLYFLHSNNNLTQEQITELVNNSNLSNELKEEYNTVLNSKEEKRYSKSNQPQEEKKVRKPALEHKGVKIYAKERINPFSGKVTGEIELENIESEERGKGNAREALNQFLLHTDVLGKNVYLDVAPRDLKTTEKKLREFYSSVGFRDNGDGLSMTRKAKKVQPPVLDSNGEARVEAVFEYANATEQDFSNENIIEARNTALAFGVETSAELDFILQKAFVENGLIVFDKSKMANAGFSEYEISKILSSDEIRGNIKKYLPYLKNTDFNLGEYSTEHVEAIPNEIGLFGKQKVKNPFIVEKTKLPQQQVKTVLEGEMVDKTESIKQVLPKTYKKQPISAKAAFFIETILNSKQNISERNQEALGKIVKELKEEVIPNGIDLKDIENRTANVENLQNFVEALQEYILDENTFDSFTDIYDEFFELNKGIEEGIKEPLTENDSVVDTELSEYELFRDFSLVRKDKNIYTKVNDKPLEELRELYKQIHPITDFEIQAQVPSLEVEDFEADVDVMEKMFMWKNHLGYPIKTVSNSKVETISNEDFKEALSNPYKKITVNGVELINNDSITKADAELIEKEEEEILEENQIFDDNLEKRKQALINKESIEKIKTDYQYIEPDVLATRNNEESFVRTPQGVFERVFEQGNVSFFSKVVSLDKNFVDTDFNNFNYLQTEGEEIKAKKYYNKKELEEINTKHFNCK